MNKFALQSQIDSWNGVGKRKEQDADRFSGESFYILKKEASEAFEVARGYHRVLRDIEEGEYE